MSLRTFGLAVVGVTLAVISGIAPAHAQQTAYAIANGGTSLIRFQTNNPGAATLVGNFSGANIFLDSIDFRPANGQLYGFKSNQGDPGTTLDSLYTINLNTAALTLVGTSGATTNTNILGMDFNPAIDRFRVVTDSTQNIVYNPNTGNLQLNAMPLTGPNVPHIIDNAYAGNLAGRTGTQYAIDYVSDSLYTLANNFGTLTTVGALGVDTDNFAGFDIYTDVSAADFAYAILNTDPTGAGGAPGFYSIRLDTGAATSIGAIGGFTQVYSLAVVPVPEPGTVALLAGMGLSGAGFLARRKRARKIA